MLDAFRAVKRNRGAAGIDKVSIQMFEANLEQNLLALMRQLKGGTYQPKPLRRVFIPKPNGKLRPLGIPAVRDRIAQEVVRQLLEPLFEPLFHDDSYGFRKGRSAHQAIQRVLELQRQGYRYVLDADLLGFFDNLPHSVIMGALTARVADGNILNLVERFLKAGVMQDGLFTPTRVGTPQGGVASPLLANIVLNRLDWYLHEHGLRFVRYADDFVVLCRSKPLAQEALALIAPFLSDALGLTLSPEKTRIASFGRGFDFLGFRFSTRAVRMRDSSVEKFKTKITDITVRSRNLDAQLIVRLNRVIRGTANYFAAPAFAGGFHSLFRPLDAWIRMRLRAMKLKRKWKTDNRRVRNKHLRRLGLLGLCDLYHTAATVS